MKPKSNSISLVKKPYHPDRAGKWTGSTMIGDIFLQKYIMKKYKNILHSVPFTSILVGYLSPTAPQVVAVFNSSKGLGYFYPQEKDQMQDYLNLYRNTKKRFTVYDITLFFQHQGQRIGHAVLFIYDRNTHTLEYYDSNPTTYKQGIFQNKRKLKSLFREIYDKHVIVDFDTNNKLCPRIPHKYLQECKTRHYIYDTGGSCLVWALWYLDFRMRNKDVPRNKAFSKAIDEFSSDPEAICKFEIAYAQFIDDFVKDYTVKVTQKKQMKRIILKK
jgi:hypothetical protein